MKRPSRLPTVIPTVSRTRMERVSITLAIVYVVSVVVVLLDVCVWRLA